MTTDAGPVTGGVDTHGQTHHAALIDGVGRHLGDREFPTTPTGYRALTAWLSSHHHLERVGVEGTGAYGAALTRHLHAHGIAVVEVDRPDRRARRAKGKSDPLDAYAAARAALSGAAAGIPKQRDGRVEAIRALRVARRGAVKARTQAMNQLKALLLTGPAELREQLRHLTEEVRDADTDLTTLVSDAGPQLLALQGFGIDVAGQLLTTAGDNPDRLRSEAAFAHLCGVAPVPASSGRTHRHRLDRGGDRAANNALHTIALCRLRYDPRTHAYVVKRTNDGPSKTEIIHCLKRYIVREIFTALQPLPAPNGLLHVLDTP